MNKILYPCKVKKEDGIFYAQFIDFENCFTDAETLEEVFVNAKDVLEAVAFHYLKNNKELPEPSIAENESNIIFVELWIDLLKDKVDTQAVKKTLTIPKWLNDLAEAKSANFSAILQRGLKEYIGIKDNYTKKNDLL